MICSSGSNKGISLSKRKNFNWTILELLNSLQKLHDLEGGKACLESCFQMTGYAFGFYS